MKNVIFILLATFSTPAFAASGTLECVFSDNMLTYKDLIVLREDNTASYEAQFARLGETNFQKICWADRLQVLGSGNQLKLEGTVTCEHDGRGNLQQTLDLDAMTTSGSWKGTYGCRWLP